MFMTQIISPDLNIGQYVYVYLHKNITNISDSMVTE